MLPVFGDSPFVVETLASLLLNIHSGEELIIVFDRADPVMAQVVVDMMPASFVFRLISSLSPGLVSALNVGVGASDRELIARIDADDVILDGRLVEQVRLFEKHPSLVALGSQSIHIDEKGIIVGRSRLPLYSWQIAAELELWNPLSHPTMMYRRRAIIDVGGYDEKALAAEDFELARRLRSLGKLRNISRPGILYRLHPAQVTQTKTSESAATISKILASDGPPTLSVDKALEIVNLYLSKHRASALGSLWLFGKHKPLNALVIVASKIVTSISLFLVKFGKRPKPISRF